MLPLLSVRCEEWSRAHIQGSFKQILSFDSLHKSLEHPSRTHSRDGFCMPACLSALPIQQLKRKCSKASIAALPPSFFSLGNYSWLLDSVWGWQCTKSKGLFQGKDADYTESCSFSPVCRDVVETKRRPRIWKPTWNGLTGSVTWLQQKSVWWARIFGLVFCNYEALPGLVPLQCAFCLLVLSALCFFMCHEVSTGLNWKEVPCFQHHPRASILFLWHSGNVLLG